MKKLFRSRGIRINRKKDNSIDTKMKIYYDADLYKVENKILDNFVTKGIIRLFEYSILEPENKIDTYNYHVDLCHKQNELLYEGIDSSRKMVLEIIPELFDSTFKNYTIGYRVNNKKITDTCYYFYPTEYRDNRYRIKGITNKSVILQESERFADYVSTDIFAKKEIIKYSSIMEKLKGVSVHLSNNKISYKLYGRIDSELLHEYIWNMIGYDLSKLNYGEVVLSAQRIEDGKITGYNVYFLQ